RPYGTLMLVPTLYFSTQVAAYSQGIAVVFNNPQDVAEDYNQLLTVSSANKDASVLNLSLISPVPAKGRDIMNKLLQVYNKEAVEDKNEASASKLSFLDRRIKSLGSELTGVEDAAQTYKQRQGIADVGVQTSSNVETESALQTKLTDWTTQIQVLQSIENYLGSSGSQYRLVPSTLNIPDQTLLGLINQFNGLQVERERLLRTNQENNPLVINTNEQLAGVAAAEHLPILDAKARGSSAGPVGYRFQLPRYRPGHGQLNDKVETKAEVEELTTTPILGEIARKRGGSTVVVSRDNRSALAEMFGLVRANLNFATAGRENKVTLITSTVPGEGKSFISINLSNSLVVMGKKVVLLDLDLRKPSLAHELSLRTEPGITDYLVSDRLSIDDVLQTSSNTPGLFIISAGSMPPNPAELLASPKLAFLLQELAERFDHILIDTPPIGLVADAFSLAPLANST
nr:tyrosine-protein kinase CpsD, putative [Tanacetum cinerariifolium]